MSKRRKYCPEFKRGTVEQAETERWAEPLLENFTRVLAENLSRQLGTAHISIEPSRSRGEIDFRVTADVLQFGADDTGCVILIAYWHVQDRDNNSLTGMTARVWLIS